MTSVLGRLFGARAEERRAVQSPPTESRVAVALRESDELLQKMRTAYQSNDPVRQAMADLWAQRHNVPYVTSVYETVQEMNAPLARSAKSAK